LGPGRVPTSSRIQTLGYKAGAGDEQPRGVQSIDHCGGTYIQGTTERVEEPSVTVDLPVTDK
jgi:hypothetical protein